MRRGRPLFQNFFFGFPGTNVVTVDITGLVCPKGCPTFVPEDRSLDRTAGSLNPSGAALAYNSATLGCGNVGA